jgi:hypothetical protein
MFAVSVRSGVVDTPLHTEIRGFDGNPDLFPMKAKFDVIHTEQPKNSFLGVGSEKIWAEKWDKEDSQ